MAETLRTAMKMAGLSQEALAKRLKRPQSYVSDMLRGRISKYGVVEVSAWAIACDLEPIVLFSMYFTRLSRRM